LLAQLLWQLLLLGFSEVNVSFRHIQRNRLPAKASLLSGSLGVGLPLDEFLGNVDRNCLIIFSL